MPIGKYKGQKVKHVPAGYIMFMLNKGYLKGQVRDYVIENLAYFEEKQYEGKKLEDHDIMPFGKHKGKQLDQVPAGYLLYIYKGLRPGLLKNYIKDNLEVLEKQVKQEGWQKNY